MADHYEVLTEALRAHARKVDGFAGRLSQAVDAAREVSLPSDAYGFCCLDLPLMLNPLQYLGMTALGNSEKLLSTTVADVERTANDYAEIDGCNALVLQRAMELR
ncbi:MAG TPA: type VII secretion target [Pseudonocardiaceae bacterium]|nr:type VII secretion target [Pseudonocardiaceae bacterium]